MNETKPFYDCVEAIDENIAKNFDGYRISIDIAEKVVEEFDFDTVKVVLANSIKQKDFDGRISRDNKLWARDINIPIAPHHRPYYIVENAGLLNIVANQFRKLERELNKPSALDQLSAIKADTEPKPKKEKSKEQEVR